MKKILAFVGLCILWSCSTDPQPIAYGKDECKFCMMKIMDARFGAEVVTDKGKVFKFDSSECMFQYMNEAGEEKGYQHILTTHIKEPNQLKDAMQSWFVVSPDIPSPMGGNLSSYPSQEIAQKVAQKNRGDLFSFTEIQEKYTTQP